MCDHRIGFGAIETCFLSSFFFIVKVIVPMSVKLSWD